MPWYLKWKSTDERTDRGIIKSSNLQSRPPRHLGPRSPLSPRHWRRWRWRRRGWGWRLPVWAPTCWWRRDRDKTGPWSALRRRGGEKPGTRSWVALCLQRQTSSQQPPGQPAASHSHPDSRRGAGAGRQKFNRFFLRSVSSPLFNLAALIFSTSSVTRECDWYVCILNKVLLLTIDMPNIFHIILPMSRSFCSSVPHLLISSRRSGNIYI